MSTSKKFSTFSSQDSVNKIFTLHVDYTELNRIIGLNSIAKSASVVYPENITKIEAVFGSKDTNLSGSTFSFLDPSKKQKRWVMTMKDAMLKTTLPEKLTKSVKCWWCHDSFVDKPLGCPLEIYDIGKKTISFYSHANKKDVVLPVQTTIGESSEDETRFYITKGYFCSWGCLLSYGHSVKKNQEHRECIQLIYQMYREYGGEGTISPAPHFSLLEEYGGPLSREEFKTKYESYTLTGNNYVRRMIPAGELVEISSLF